MTRPTLPIDINTNFQISIGNFSEISEEEIDYNPIQLSRNDSYNTFEPEIINGCCCTTPTFDGYWTEDFTGTDLIINQDPKTYIKFNNNPDLPGMYASNLHLVPNNNSSYPAYSPYLTDFDLEMYAPPDIVIGSTSNYLVCYGGFYNGTIQSIIGFSFIIQLSYNTQKISFHYSSNYYNTTTTNNISMTTYYGSSIYVQYPMYNKILNIGITALQAVPSDATHGNVRTVDNQYFRENYDGNYSSSVLPTIDVKGI